MEKCEVCGKTTLLPEKLGKSIICKKCLLKIDGLLWRYHHFENSKDLEKSLAKVLELAKKNNFPEKVIDGIKEYFNNQESSMLKCDACQEIVSSYKKLGETILCKKCFAKINTEEFKREDYFSHEELEKDKEKVIKIARKNNFPDTIINNIIEYFNKKISKNLQYTIDGEKGQILKVYNDYLTITTTDEFLEDEVEREYQKILKGNHLTKGDIEAITEVGGEFLNDLIGFNPLRNGILKSVTKFATNKASDNKSNIQFTFNIQEGSLKINYQDYDYINFYRPKEDDKIGFLLLRNIQKYQNGASDILFFFENDDDIINKIKKITTFLENKITSKSNNRNQIKDVSSELRELKSLLDDGIITSDDFEKKKKELLNLK